MLKVGDNLHAAPSTDPANYIETQLGLGDIRDEAYGDIIERVANPIPDPKWAARLNSQFPIPSHPEEIICAGCKTRQTAKVEHTTPFWTYIHHCQCGFINMESDWEVAT